MAGGDGAQDRAGSVYSGALIRTTGPAFNATPFDPARVTRTEAGTATFTFANGNAATFAYTLNGVSRTKAIARQLFVPPAGTRCGEPVAATIKGKVFDGYLERALVCADVNGNGRCDPDEVQTLTDAAGAYELMAPAGFSGPLVAEVVAGQSREVGRRGRRSIAPTAWHPRRASTAPTSRPSRRWCGFPRSAISGSPRRSSGTNSGSRRGSASTSTLPRPTDPWRQAVAKSVVAALKATAATLDFSSPDALAKVVAAFPPALTELPQLRITTKDGAPIESKEIYVDATFTLTNPAAAPRQADLNGKIRGRGNLTWLQDKKPYKVQFTNDASYAKVPDFLGMKKNRNWALLADYLDRALMRNKLAFSLGNSSLFADGLKWTPSGQHVEVTLNGEYAGVYLLTEDIRHRSRRA